MLRNLQMALSQKLGLAAIFAIVIIDIIFDILRTVYFNSAVLSQFPDVSAVWDLCEPSIAVIVCSLPSYRTLLSRQKSDASVPYQNMDVVPLRYSKGLPGATELDDFRAYSVGAKLITGTGFRIHNHISYQLIQLRRILPASTLMDQSSWHSPTQRYVIFVSKYHSRSSDKDIRYIIDLGSLLGSRIFTCSISRWNKQWSSTMCLRV